MPDASYMWGARLPLVVERAWSTDSRYAGQWCSGNNISRRGEFYCEAMQPMQVSSRYMEYDLPVQAGYIVRTDLQQDNWKDL